PPQLGPTRGDRRSSSTMIYVDGLDLGEKIDSVAALLMRADTGGFDATEWQVDLAAEGRLVDMRDADVDSIDEAEDRLDVVRVDRCGKSVFDRIGGFEGFIGVGDADDREHRAEDLFPRDSHLRAHAGEYRRRPPGPTPQ